MKNNLAIRAARLMRFNFFTMILLRISLVIALAFIASGIKGQDCNVTLKVNTPAPVCAPSTVDLTSGAITAGSTEGFQFTFYLDKEFTIPIPDPTKAGAGKYYVKGIISDEPCPSIVTGSVKITVFDKPRLVITDPVIDNADATADITIPEVTAGSDSGLLFSYWYDIEAKEPLLSPKLAPIGNYFIKGTLVNGCFDIQPITIKIK